MRFPNPLHANTLVTDRLTDANLCVGLHSDGSAQRGRVPVAVPAYWKALVARANRTLFFSRALKLVNGGLGSLPKG